MHVKNAYLAALAEGRNTPGLPVELVPLGATVKQELGGKLHRSGMGP